MRIRGRIEWTLLVPRHAIVTPRDSARLDLEVLIAAGNVVVSIDPHPGPGSELDLISMDLGGDCPGSVSITCRDSFRLSFLFFHWVRSCLDLAESIEA